jgi:hypothetical protein
VPDPADRDRARDAEVRHLPVLAGERAPEPLVAEPRPPAPARAPLPAPVIAAAGGFVLGVVTYVLVRVLRAARRPAGVVFGRRKRAKPLEIAATRSFLVDVHLLKR